MESAVPIKDLKGKVTDRQILSIALPITLAILIPQINMLTNSIFLGNLSTEALGNAGIVLKDDIGNSTGFYLEVQVSVFSINSLWLY